MMANEPPYPLPADLGQSLETLLSEVTDRELVHVLREWAGMVYARGHWAGAVQQRWRDQYDRPHKAGGAQ
jgi:hypothetical protein